MLRVTLVRMSEWSTELQVSRERRGPLPTQADPRNPGSRMMRGGKGRTGDKGSGASVKQFIHKCYWTHVGSARIIPVAKFWEEKKGKLFILLYQERAKSESWSRGLRADLRNWDQTKCSSPLRSGINSWGPAGRYRPRRVQVLNQRPNLKPAGAYQWPRGACHSAYKLNFNSVEWNSSI